MYYQGQETEEERRLKGKIEAFQAQLRDLQQRQVHNQNQWQQAQLRNRNANPPTQVQHWGNSIPQLQPQPQMQYDLQRQKYISDAENALAKITKIQNEEGSESFCHANYELEFGADEGDRVNHSVGHARGTYHVFFRGSVDGDNNNKYECGYLVRGGRNGIPKTFDFYVKESPAQAQVDQAQAQLNSLPDAKEVTYLIKGGPDGNLNSRQAAIFGQCWKHFQEYVDVEVSRNKELYKDYLLEKNHQEEGNRIKKENSRVFSPFKRRDEFTNRRNFKKDLKLTPLKTTQDEDKKLHEYDYYLWEDGSVQKKKNSTSFKGKIPLHTHPINKHKEENKVVFDQVNNLRREYFKPGPGNQDEYNIRRFPNQIAEIPFFHETQPQQPQFDPQSQQPPITIEEPQYKSIEEGYQLESDEHEIDGKLLQITYTVTGVTINGYPAQSLQDNQGQIEVKIGDKMVFYSVEGFTQEQANQIANDVELGYVERYITSGHLKVMRDGANINLPEKFKQQIPENQAVHSVSSHEEEYYEDEYQPQGQVGKWTENVYNYAGDTGSFTRC